MTTVAVISDDRLACDGVLRLLADLEDCAATGFSDGREASDFRGLFQIAIVDARMEGALETCRELSSSDTLAVILRGVPCDDGWAVEALRAGARGILTQEARSDELRRAIRVVANGDLWVRRQWLHAWLQESAKQRDNGHHLAHVRAQLDAPLSRREREVSHQAATGISNREIARRLGISEATVKVHLSRIFKKLGFSGRAGLAAAYHGASGLAPEDAGRRAS